MKYTQLRDGVHKLWMDHAGGVPLAPVDRKTWIQNRMMDALMEYTDASAKHVYAHLAFDFQLSEVQTVQFEDWIAFARDYGFAYQLTEENATP